MNALFIKKSPFETTCQFSESKFLFWTWFVLASSCISKNKVRELVVVDFLLLYCK